MNINSAIKLLCTAIDYGIEDYPGVRDALEDASILIAKEYGFDTNDVKIDIIEGKLADYWVGEITR